jgi:hypothetical protein
VVIAGQSLAFELLKGREGRRQRDGRESAERKGRKNMMFSFFAILQAFATRLLHGIRLILTHVVIAALCALPLFRCRMLSEAEQWRLKAGKGGKGGKGPSVSFFSSLWRVFTHALFSSHPFSIFHYRSSLQPSLPLSCVWLM